MTSARRTYLTGMVRDALSRVDPGKSWIAIDLSTYEKTADKERVS
jgi:hypothetical protein